MKNTEIRIGNYIKRKGLVVKVDEQTFWDMKNNPDEYEPILINRNWLLRFKLSFQNNGRVAFYFDDEINIEEIEGVFYFHFSFLKKRNKIYPSTSKPLPRSHFGRIKFKLKIYE